MNASAIKKNTTSDIYLKILSKLNESLGECNLIECSNITIIDNAQAFI